MLVPVNSQGVVNSSGIPKRCVWSRYKGLSSILQNIQPKWFLLDTYVHDVRDIFIVIKIACNTCKFSDRYAKHLILGKRFAVCHLSLSHSTVFNRKHDYDFTYGYKPQFPLTSQYLTVKWNTAKYRRTIR